MWCKIKKRMLRHNASGNCVTGEGLGLSEKSTWKILFQVDGKEGFKKIILCPNLYPFYYCNSLTSYMMKTHLWQTVQRAIIHFSDRQSVLHIHIYNYTFITTSHNNN